MKRLFLVVLLTVASAAIPARAQTATPPTHDHAQSQAHHEEPVPSMCQKMMEEHLAEIKATSQTLASNLAQLKSMLPLIADLNERNRWQSNIAMWQALADHFNHMAQHAEHMQSMGMSCGTVMGHGMITGLGSDGGHDHSASPAKP